MGTVLDIDPWRKETHLGALVDPCSECDDKEGCKVTCEKAVAWWDSFAKKFTKTNQELGGA